MPGLFFRVSEIRFRRHGFSAVAALLMAAYAGAAFAQGGTGNGTGAESTTPENHASPAPTSPAVKGSTKNGVITPKGDVDPNMTKAPPAKGTTNMPVIKPKGMPGGQPGPTPK
ncbi:MAG: hypothetical protein EPN75_14185 [Beijerinckiaceae bacterium]|nr:MAG: hypothetical protein EPN75_14185 [Beijerinckiaceae bacterium]